MGLMSETVKVKWNVANKNHYESKGYTFTWFKEEFDVKVEDLSVGSHSIVEVDCDGCGKSIPSEWKQYLKYARDNGECFCKDCVHYERIQSSLKSRLENSISIAQYIINTFGEKGLQIYWNYEENDKLGLNPWNISFGSRTNVAINCLEKDYHKFYMISCSDFVRGRRCPYCTNRKGKVHPLDSLGKLLEDKGLLHLWSNKNKRSPYEYPVQSNQKVWWKCPEGKHEDYLRFIYNSTSNNFRCSECQFSQGEKRIEEYLMKNNIRYTAQTEYEGLVGLGGGNLSYDFYILNPYNILVEYDGEFHYKPIKKYKNEPLKYAQERFEKQKEHDRLKNEYAHNNGVNLLRIPYWDFDDIEEILDNYLSQFKNIKSA